MKDLAQKMNMLCDVQPFNVSWYLKDLMSGMAADRVGDTVVASRSTRKVSIMMALLKSIHDGKYSLTQRITIPEKYQNTASGVTPFLLPGMELSLRDALILMIIVSDNPCTAVIVDMLSIPYLNEYCASIGMKETIHRYSLPLQTSDLNLNTVICARDQGMLFEMILKGSTDEMESDKLGCTAEQCRFAMQVMNWQRCDLKIASLLPVPWPPDRSKGAMVASKGGIGPGMFSETGIVFKEGRPCFVLCVYNWEVPAVLPDGKPGAAGAAQLIGQLARMSWEALG
jgi:beta-lactamase class A